MLREGRGPAAHAAAVKLEAGFREHYPQSVFEEKCVWNGASKVWLKG